MTHNRETFSLSESKNIYPCHPAEDGNPSPVCCNRTSTANPGGRKLKQRKGSAYLWNQLIPGHAGSPPLAGTAAARWQRLQSAQQTPTSGAPARLFCMNLGCDSAWEYSFKTETFRQRAPKKNNSQAKSSSSFFLLLFLIAPGMSFFGLLF